MYFVFFASDLRLYSQVLTGSETSLEATLTSLNGVSASSLSKVNLVYAHMFRVLYPFRLLPLCLLVSRRSLLSVQ